MLARDDHAPYEKSDKKEEEDSDEGTSVDPPFPQPKLDQLHPKPDPEKPSPKLDPEKLLPDKPDEPPLGTKDAPTKPEAGDIGTELEDKITKLQLEDPYRYHMENQARGLFVLFNVVNFIGQKDMKRQGTDVDAKKLEATFRRMHFEVMTFEDPTALEMVEILKTGNVDR